MCGSSLPAHLVGAASREVVGAAEGEQIGSQTTGQLAVGGEPVLVFEVRAQIDPVVESIIQAASEGDEVVSKVVDVGYEAGAWDESLVCGKVHDAAAVENLAVWSKAATIVVAEIAAPDLVCGFGEVIAWNKRVLVGISDPMKIGLDAIVAEEVIVRVEGKAGNIVRHVVGVSPGEAGADLKVCGAAGCGRRLTLGEGSEENRCGKKEKNV